MASNNFDSSFFRKCSFSFLVSLARALLDDGLLPALPPAHALLVADGLDGAGVGTAQKVVAHAPVSH